jgi:hypothetical protein
MASLSLSNRIARQQVRIQYAPPLDFFMYLCARSFHFYRFDCEVEKTIDVIDYFAARNRICSRPVTPSWWPKKKKRNKQRIEDPMPRTFCLFMFNLMTSPVFQPMLCRMTVMVNNALGRMWKGLQSHNLRYYSDIFLEGPRKTAKYTSQNVPAEIRTGYFLNAN